MTIQEKIRHALQNSLKQMGISYDGSIQLEHPNELAHGDFATNIAMVLAKQQGENPRALAETIAQQLLNSELAEISHVEVAGPGFINLTLHPSFLNESVGQILEHGSDYGKHNLFAGQKIITEFTDPNPFKLFHIGHLMSNTIGESLARIFQNAGAEVKWANYQGDVGMHVAKTLWGIIDLGGYEEMLSKDLQTQVAFMGRAYAHGSTTYKDKQHVEDMQDLNKKIYARSDETINNIYDWGRQVSLDYFETQYKRLGTNHNVEENKAFHYYFFESKVGDLGKEKVLEYLEKGIFKESDGAIIFPGEDHGLHSRVFVNKLGLPTYEAKELGLSKIKHDEYPYDQSFIITANEIDEYFKVLLKAMSFVFPELAAKTTHISHGMMKLTSGKMSSRTGDVITAEDMLNDVRDLAFAKIMESQGEKYRGLEASQELHQVIEQVAVAAVKFAILKQDTSKDIIFDPEVSLSFEGDSGPYLQYTYARCQSILHKAQEEDLVMASRPQTDWQTLDLERYFYRFQEVIVRAADLQAPHVIANYAIELGRMFNRWYGQGKIVDSENPHTSYKLALVSATGIILKRSLFLLGIQAPESM